MRDHLRVLHVISTPTGFGGAEDVVRHLVRDGAARGDDVRVATPFARSAEDLSAAQAYYAPAAVHGRVLRGVLDLPGAAAWLEGTLRRVRPHVVHTHLFHAAVLSAALPRHGAVRLATHHHGGLLGWQGRRAEARLDAWSARRADHVVAVSEAVRRHLVEVAGLPADRVSVIRNGWSGAPLPHRGSPGGAQVVCVGNLRPEKGHELLLHAFAAVRCAVPHARLVLAGDGPRRPALQALAERLELSDAVVFAGRVPDVWPLLATSDVFALATEQEALGIAVLEALAAGLPVVATAVGGIPEVLPPDAGALVPPGDAAALATALTALLQDPARRAAAGRAAREQADRTTSAAMVSAYADLYDRLVRIVPGGP